MNSRKTNYVIAAWSGERRETLDKLRDSSVYENDRACYLRTHLSAIVRHSQVIDHVTVVVPHNPDESADFNQFIRSIEVDGWPEISNISVLRRPNDRLSFGSYSDAFDLFRMDFTHWIFIEDDYVFCLDGFDRALLDLYDDLHARSSCGFLAARVRRRRVTRRSYAAVCVGITTTDVLDVVWEQNGCLPGNMPSTFSDGFLDAGFSLSDLRGVYNVRFCRHGYIRNEFFGSKPLILSPIEEIVK